MTDPKITDLTSQNSAEIGEHLRYIRAYASAINERNFSDIALHIKRQADAALLLTAADRGTP